MILNTMSSRVSEVTYIFIYLYFVDGDRYLSVDFGNSSSEAVLKFYPAVAAASNVSSVCLRFNVFISSPAVELLIAVVDVAEDSKDVRSDNENRLQQNDTGWHSVTVLHGRQYVVFTAQKVKVTRIPDRVEIRNISYSYGSCKNDTKRK